MASVREALHELNVTVTFLNQRESVKWALRGDGTRCGSGRLDTGDANYVNLDEVAGVYVRLMDYARLARLDGHEEALPRLAVLHEGFKVWLQYAPARVVNRPAAMLSNSSKPYQSRLIAAAGFRVPRTIITNKPEDVLALIEQVGPLVYKSISGTRSIVELFDGRDVERLELIRWCPTQFQEFIPGHNVRVHVISTETIATAIATRAIDYRYAARDGCGVSMTAVDLDRSISRKCVRLAKRLGLSLAGIDLRLREDGTPVCLEVNPMPAFSYYQERTGQPIARLVASYLADQLA